MWKEKKFFWNENIKRKITKLSNSKIIKNS